MEALLKLKSVLCDPAGLVCVAGSEADREIIQSSLSELAAEIEAARAEIERKMSAGQFVVEQLANEQAKNVGLREALENHPGNYKLSKDECAKINALLDAPSDTSALEVLVKKAGEAMRERSINVAWNKEPDCDGPIETGIRALPAVKLEDLT